MVVVVEVDVDVLDEDEVEVVVTTIWVVVVVSDGPMESHPDSTIPAPIAIAITDRCQKCFFTIPPLSA